jgi:cytochrome c biogenesis protein CcmG/thiol:disulfide interchange protein DsbE
VDEGSVEPSPAALTSFLGHLRRPLSYPVAIDRSGQVADGYEVQGVPWLVLTSPTGRIAWSRDVSTSGWPGRNTLVRDIHAALAAAPSTAGNVGAPAEKLAGSSGPLAALHGQSGQLLGTNSALMARLRALRGYPVVVNAWASWCTPCRSEFGLFAAASFQYGRQVAFLGANTDDSAGDARAFLARHPVSYPSYQTSESGLGSLAVIEGLPTTIFISPAGKVVFVHIGQYESQGTLDENINSYALRR